MLVGKKFGEYNQEDVSEANRVYYQDSESYDTRVITQDSHQRLYKLLEVGVQLLEKQFQRPITALDVCGGSGNASFILHDMGCQVTLVDISPAMISVFARHCQETSKQIKSIEADASKFLASDGPKYDLIVFSSAIHHFRDPYLIIESALKRLTKGGLVITVADPTLKVSKKWFRIISTFDNRIYTLRKDPKYIGKRLVKKLSQFRKVPISQAQKSHVHFLSNVGRIAEYQTNSGIDDEVISNRLVQSGYFIVAHRRYSGGYNRIFQILYRLIKAHTSFLFMISNEDIIAGKGLPTEI